jgi:Lon protease-like protein
MGCVDDESPDLGAVPLFPLPNVVLFPRAVLPLHIFEERYKAMTADTLREDGRIAMALLKPGWEKCYYQHPAIEPVVCVGIILSHERLADGTYNFLLQGVTRARIARELDGKPYRIAQLNPLCETHVLELDFDDERRRLTALFDNTALAATGIGKQFRRMIAGPMPTADIADLVAFSFLDDLCLRQALLADGDVKRRVGRTIDALAAAASHLSPDLAEAERVPGLN